MSARMTLPRGVAQRSPVAGDPQVEAQPAPSAEAEGVSAAADTLGRTRAQTLPRIRMMAQPLTSLGEARERWARRLLNIVVAAVGLVLAFPVMLVIAALVKLTSRGPVLFDHQGARRRRVSGLSGLRRRLARHHRLL